jgi:hypothetical protein
MRDQKDRKSLAWMECRRAFPRKRAQSINWKKKMQETGNAKLADRKRPLGEKKKP